MNYNKQIEQFNSILFLTTNNITTNPRLQKELLFFSRHNKKNDFIGFILGNWSDEIEKSYNNKINADFTYIDISKKRSLNVIVSTLISKISKILNKIFKKNLFLSALSHNKRTFLIIRQLKKKKIITDLIIAHNLGALYPAFLMSKKFKIPFIFDVEDYHPGEAGCSPAEERRRELLMKKILPQAFMVTYASPLIGKYTMELVGNVDESNYLLINNSFDSNEFHFEQNTSNKVRFVWFSQNISSGRGLELALTALQKFKDNVEVHLVGNLYQEFWGNFLHNYKDFVTIHLPMPQNQLHSFICSCDTGLAIEISTVDLNKQIALSNKIFAYSQAGLFVLATDTPAQKKYIEQNSSLGIISQQNTKDFENNIQYILENITSIRQNKLQRFEYSKKFDIKNEIKKVYNIS